MKEGRKPGYRRNGEIKINGDRVRLVEEVGEGENRTKSSRIVTLAEARNAAAAQNLDLVEIEPNADPPVVRIQDYNKLKFSLKKQRGAKKQKQTKLKEQKFRPGTDVNDYEVKVRNLRSFLEKGDRAKVTIVFRGREMAHQELGVQLLERIKADLADISKVDFFPKLEGRQLVMILAPK